MIFSPDPGSIKISTIGGNIAEKSGGLRGLKYGVTRDYVMGLEVVSADGSVVWLERTRQHRLMSQHAAGKRSRLKCFALLC
ncbi:MAG TPA: FAD-binding protein [Verrucomicrobiae bacterium]|nr:FAD-binding protein [Verrucomicrobiae bacterium]